MGSFVCSCGVGLYPTGRLFVLLCVFGWRGNVSLIRRSTGVQRRSSFLEEQACRWIDPCLSYCHSASTLFPLYYLLHARRFKMLHMRWNCSVTKRMFKLFSISGRTIWAVLCLDHHFTRCSTCVCNVCVSFYLYFITTFMRTCVLL